MGGDAPGRGGGSGSSGPPESEPPESGRLSEDDRTLHIDEVRSAGGAAGVAGTEGASGVQAAGTAGAAGSGARPTGTGGASDPGARPSRSRGLAGLAGLPGLAPGDVLAGRFRIVGFLGKGGMGEVYEAQDIDLGERVAVKTLLPAIAADPTSLARFRREIHLARRVTHPNVCRLFDLWRHRPAADGGPGQEITFLTMELLAGETLTRRLREGGRFSPEEALPVVRQIAGGLTAAHQAGVVHRDFKSGNVMLVPQPDGGLRAVITDFGLARAAAAEEPALAVTLTAAGKIVGSPPYMAPEQVRGEEAGAAADVYAFGVVLYEMVTGRLPFVADSALGTAVKRLSEPPPPPRQAAPDLPAPWEAVILHCLAREPAQRPESLAVAVEALAGEKAASGGRLRRWLPAAAAAAAALALLLAVALVWVLRRPADGPPAAPVTDRPALAVLTFHNLAADPEAGWLATALPELLAADLGSGTALRLVPRETVARAELELAPPAGSLPPEVLGRLHDLLAAEYVVAGSYIAGGAGGLRLDVTLQPTDGGGEARTMVSERGRQQELARLAARIADRLRSTLGVPSGAAPPPVELATVGATRAYAEGLARLRRFDALGARDRLAVAVEADPDSPFAHAALADAWKELGYDARAKAEAQRAFELAAELPWEQRQILEGRAAAAARRWDEAIRVYTSLASVFPDNLEYGLLLADAQAGAGRGAAALETVERLQALPPPAGEDPRLGLAEAEAAASQADYERQLAAARRAAARAEELGVQLLVARLRLQEGQALERRGDFAGAQQAYRQATRLFANGGDRVGEARSLHSMAILLAQQGNLAGARELLAGALATYRQVGSRRDEARALSNQANLALVTGDLAAATRLYEEALAIGREIQDRRGEARELTNLAVAMKLQGELEEAEERYRRVLEIWRQIGDRAQVALTRNNLANVLREQGRQDEAREMFRSALALFDEVGDRPNAAGAASNLASIEAMAGDLEEAERLHRQALEIYREIGAEPQAMGQRWALAQLDARRGRTEGAAAVFREALAVWDAAGISQAVGAREQLAWFLLETGAAGEAETPARQAAEGYAAAGSAAGEARALALAAWAQAATGRGGEAGRTAEQARQLLSEQMPPAERLPAQVALARADALGGRRDRALEQLRELVEATAAGDLDPALALEARLALGEVETAAGLTGPGTGRSRLAAVETDARSASYELLARRAAQARRGEG